MRGKLIVVLSVVIGLAGGIIGTKILYAQQAPVERKPLLQVDLGENDLEATMFVTELAPGGQTPKHFHPGHVMGFILEGSVAVEEEGGAVVEAREGEALYETPVHVILAKNLSASDPVKIPVVMVNKKGQPLMVLAGPVQ